ncbi:MAG: beta-lactamase family protein [Pleurocapsa minor GSE-CHR-MK-17-07R]|nr:beta-lactamase family protein [Pleurocapsa minor GSE-CHR-MK 17-07R]
MRSQLEALMRTSEVTALAIASLSNGHLNDVHVFGETNTDTVWTVASLTKPVFAYGVMLLVQKGLIELDRPLQTYLPSPYLDDPVFLPHMTARHALSHTTGFPNWRDSDGLRAAFMPGTRFSYSSEGLTYLQYVVESIIGMPVSTYLAEQVFRPLGMHRTELKSESVTDLPPMLHFLSESLMANSALSLRTTVEDYGRFMAAILDNAPEIAEMTRPQIAIQDVPNLHWGLGWGLQTSPSDLSFWHWGARGMPRTMNFVIGFPAKRSALVIFTNHANGLYLCRSIVELWSGEPDMPAFEWLLPAQDWRPDGKRQRQSDN